jgi:hypothetical protein
LGGGQLAAAPKIGLTNWYFDNQTTYLLLAGLSGLLAQILRNFF